MIGENEEKNKQGFVFVTHGSSSIPQRHIIRHSSVSMSALWVCYKPVGQTEVNGWLLTKWSNLPGSGMIWGSGNPSFTADVGAPVPLVVWNQGSANSPVLIINARSTQWREPDVRLRLVILLGTATRGQCTGHLQQSLFETPVTFRDAFKMSSQLRFWTPTRPRWSIWRCLGYSCNKSWSWSATGWDTEILVVLVPWRRKVGVSMKIILNVKNLFDYCLAFQPTMIFCTMWMRR